MKIKVFAKRLYGEKFVYLSALVRKEDGERLPVEVRFRRSCGKPDPDDCPVMIEVERENCDLTFEEYTNRYNEQCKAAKLWVRDYEIVNDDSENILDEFDSFEQ